MHYIQRWRKLKLYKKRKSRQEFSKFIYYLKKHGYLKIKETRNKIAVLLTPRGWQKALKFKYKKQMAERKFKKRKDRKWIMIFFDIPEKMKKKRNWLRKNLRYLAFMMLQKSIWVSPYDVLNDTELLIKSLKLEKYVKLLLVEEIEV